jgi:hypothetical protein
MTPEYSAFLAPVLEQALTNVLDRVG